MPPRMKKQTNIWEGNRGMIILPLAWIWEWTKRLLSCQISVEVEYKKRGKNRNG